MKVFTIARVTETEDGTFGVLISQDGTPFALTLELKWRDNKPDISCIPPGEYICKRVNSPHFGETFEITGVQGRTNILFHKGNDASLVGDGKADTRGCVLVGEEFDPLPDGRAGIVHSGDGFNEFLGLLKGESQFLLYINSNNELITV